MERCTSREKGQPLCMAQYSRLLGSCRRPGDPRDSQYLPKPRPDQHVIVCCRNQMYCVPVKAADRGRLTEEEIASQLVFVLSDAPCLPARPVPVGLLTAQPRSVWAADRLQLLQLDTQNAHNIELIETALCLVCVDDSLPISFNANRFAGAARNGHETVSNGRDETNMAHQMIHGGGSDFNSANRWFDKTMQIIICNDGAWGLCYEHSTSEGIAVVLLLEQIVRQIDALAAAAADGAMEGGGGGGGGLAGNGGGGGTQHLPPPERLDWRVSPELEQRLEESARSFNGRIEDLDFYVYRYKNYGKTFIKGCQVSPDVYIQLSLQLAYYK